MQTVERQGSFFRFRLRPFDPEDPGGGSSELLLERELTFGTPSAAAAFLRHFAHDPFAVRGLHSVLARLGPATSIHEMPDQWIERLAQHLAAGRVAVVEQVPRAPAGESSEVKGPSPASMPPPPRRAETPQSAPEQDKSTFAHTSDEEAQAQALVDAAKNGTPFCEECAKAAAAANAARNPVNA